MLTFCLCGICCVQRGKDRAETWRNSKNTCGQHMTVWGGIWLFILVISPAAIVAGVLYLVLAIVAVLLNIVGFLVQK